MRKSRFVSFEWCESAFEQEVYLSADGSVTALGETRIVRRTINTPSQSAAVMAALWSVESWLECGGSLASALDGLAHLAIPSPLKPIVEALHALEIQVREPARGAA